MCRSNVVAVRASASIASALPPRTSSGARFCGSAPSQRCAARTRVPVSPPAASRALASTSSPARAAAACCQVSAWPAGVACEGIGPLPRPCSSAAKASSRGCVVAASAAALRCDQLRQACVIATSDAASACASGASSAVSNRAYGACAQAGGASVSAVTHRTPAMRARDPAPRRRPARAWLRIAFNSPPPGRPCATRSRPPTRRAGSS